MDHCLVHPSPEKLPPEANGSKYRDTDRQYAENEIPKNTQP